MTAPRHALSPLCTMLMCAFALSAMPATAASRTSAAADVSVQVMQPLPVRDSAGGMWPVQLDVARLRAARAGETLRFTLPDGSSFDIVFASMLGGASGLQWIGHHAAGRQYAVRLRLDGELATGVIRTPDGGFVLGHVDGVQLIGPDLSAAANPVVLDGLPSMFLAADVATHTGSASDPTARTGEPPAEVAHPVAFNLIALSALEPGDDVTLSIPEHGDYRVRYDRTDAGDADTTTWVGHLADYGSEFRVIVTSGPNGSVGNILTPSGELMLVDSGGTQWLVDPVRSGLSQFESEHADAVGEEVPAAAGGVTALGGTSAAADAGTTGSTTAGSGTAANGSETMIDLLVLYTPGFKKKHGSVFGTRIAQLVALANQAYVDSGVPMRLRLVASEQVNDSDTTGNSTTLSALARATGAYRTVPALRKKYGADLVTVVRPFYMTAQGGSCGVGYVGGYNGSNIAYYGNYAYSVVSDGRDMAGSNYYCTDYTFTHELGHNMGLMHDRATVARQGGGQGSHPYAFGHGRSGSFGSIMSYISPVIGRFSNPDLTDCGGSFACGVPVTDPASAHNALALRNNRAAVSSWLATTVPTSYQVSGTISRAGKPLANVPVAATNGATCSSSGKTGAYACTVPWGWSGTITPQPASGSAQPGSLALSTVRAAQMKKNFIVR
ncbi:MAG: hypothetical protein DI561_12285 [Thauera sp.]|nr:MAG: hypothetical protein DI561_12285 [Thauera sp.]